MEEQSQASNQEVVSSEAVSVQQETAKTTKFCSNCGQQIDINAEICPKCGVRVAPPPVVNVHVEKPPREPKDKTTAAVLGIFLGGLGIHKFYLGGSSTKWGVIYLVFCWTFIPAIIGFIEGIMFLMMDDAQFHANYG
jgi:TM2 domain-containing membrane protein YozV/ribosomal protein L32